MTDEEFREWLAAMGKRSRDAQAKVLRDLARDIGSGKAKMVAAEFNTTPLGNGMFSVVLRFEMSPQVVAPGLRAG